MNMPRSARETVPKSRLEETSVLGKHGQIFEQQSIMVYLDNA